MVAISLYRGNLHRVPEVPREWVMPSRKISVKHFKALLHRRSKALSRLQSSSNPITIKQGEEEQEENPPNHHHIQSESDPPPPKDHNLTDNSDSLPNSSSAAVDHHIPVNPNSQSKGKEIVLSDKEERKWEVEEKLKVLNQRKHNLILNAEEELKRRSSMQGLPVRPSVSLQVDVTTNDSGSMTRHLTPRLGSDGNPVVGDVEGGDANDASNQNMRSHHTLRMSSISPSSDSIHRRPSAVFANGVPHASRATLGASASPSRFAPTGQQGHPANLPTVSVSGTNYFASSPSPAASSGTSVFRDGRRPSPWN